MTALPGSARAPRALCALAAMLLLGCENANQARWKKEFETGKISSAEHQSLKDGARDSELIRKIENLGTVK